MRLQPDFCFPASISMCSDISAPFSIPKFRSFLFPYERQIFLIQKKTVAYYLKNRHASCRFIRKKKENKDECKTFNTNEFPYPLTEPGSPGKDEAYGSACADDIHYLCHGLLASWLSSNSGTDHYVSYRSCGCRRCPYGASGRSRLRSGIRYYQPDHSYDRRQSVQLHAAFHQSARSGIYLHGSPCSGGMALRADLCSSQTAI